MDTQWKYYYYYYNLPPPLQLNTKLTFVCTINSILSFHPPRSRTLHQALHWPYYYYSIPKRDRARVISQPQDSTRSLCNKSIASSLVISVNKYIGHSEHNTPNPIMCSFYYINRIRRQGRRRLRWINKSVIHSTTTPPPPLWPWISICHILLKQYAKNTERENDTKWNSFLYLSCISLIEH